jgi:ketosteroid isomerase-like protein
VTAEDTVALARRTLAALAEGGFDAAARYYSRDIVWDLEAMGLGTYEGLDAFRRFFAEWTGAYEDWTLELGEIAARGADRVFSVFFQAGRLHGSEAKVELRYAQISEERDGMWVRLTTYGDIDEARAAAGLAAPGA